jgi:membrane-bound hydrogenase subunit mbhJ
MDFRRWGLKKSPWVFHVNTGACNNCDIEILDLLTPRFDVERFGITLVGSPRHADAILVTGICTRQATPRLQEIYRQTPKPCLVIAIGSCGLTRGIFHNAYHGIGPVDVAIREVDPNAIIAYVPGCPPKPEAMILGVVKALSIL